MDSARIKDLAGSDADREDSNYNPNSGGSSFFSGRRRPAVGNGQGLIASDNSQGGAVPQIIQGRVDRRK